MRRSSSDYIRWTLESLFSSKLDSVCPFANHSYIFVDLNHLNVSFSILFYLNFSNFCVSIFAIQQKNELYELEPKASEVIALDKLFNNRNMFVYDLKSIFMSEPNKAFDLYLGYERSSIFKSNQKYSLLNMHRYVTGICFI